MRLALIRHPRPSVAPGLCYGQTDLPLAEPVAPIAARLREQLPPEAPVFSSPLQRARQLAQQLDPTAQTDPRLMEMNFGAWEMQPWETLPRAALDAWAADPLGWVAPGGESVAQLRARVLACVASWQQAGYEQVIAVTHAGVIRVLAGALQGLPESEWLQLPVDYASVTVLQAGR